MAQAAAVRALYVGVRARGCDVARPCGITSTLRAVGVLATPREVTLLVARLRKSDGTELSETAPLTLREFAELVVTLGPPRIPCAVIDGLTPDQALFCCALFVACGGRPSLNGRVSPAVSAPIVSALGLPTGRLLATGDAVDFDEFADALAPHIPAAIAALPPIRPRSGGPARPSSAAAARPQPAADRPPPLRKAASGPAEPPAADVAGPRAAARPPRVQPQKRRPRGRSPSAAAAAAPAAAEESNPRPSRERGKGDRESPAPRGGACCCCGGDGAPPAAACGVCDATAAVRETTSAFVCVDGPPCGPRGCSGAPSSSPPPSCGGCAFADLTAAAEAVAAAHAAVSALAAAAARNAATPYLASLPASSLVAPPPAARPPPPAGPRVAPPVAAATTPPRPTPGGGEVGGGS